MLHSLDEHLSQGICLSSSATDILVLLLDMVSLGHHRNLSSLKFWTGKGANHKEIDVIQRVQAIGMHIVSKSYWKSSLHWSRLGREVSWYRKDIPCAGKLTLVTRHLKTSILGSTVSYPKPISQQKMPT